MIHKMRLEMDVELIQATINNVQEQLWFCDSKLDADVVLVPDVYWELFCKHFPGAVELEQLADVPVFWNLSTRLCDSVPEIRQEITCNAVALGASKAVYVGYNCEEQLSRYGYGINRALPGFYVPVTGGKSYIFAVMGTDDDEDTRAFLLDVYENDENLAAFLGVGG